MTRFGCAARARGFRRDHQHHRHHHRRHHHHVVVADAALSGRLLRRYWPLSTWLQGAVMPGDISVWSVGQLAEAMRVAPHTLRRAMQAAVRSGAMPNRRLSDHFRFAFSEDFPAIAAVLRSWRYTVPDVAGGVVDETATTIARAARTKHTARRSDENGTRV
jgi:hypothetical protein